MTPSSSWCCSIKLESCPSVHSYQNEQTAFFHEKTGCVSVCCLCCVPLGICHSVSAQTFQELSPSLLQPSESCASKPCWLSKLDVWEYISHMEVLEVGVPMDGWMWGPNSSLLKEKLGVVISLLFCVASPRLGLMARLCLSLSFLH